MWEEQGADSELYSRTGLTVWDDGDTIWDVSGNVVVTGWDRSDTQWVDTPRVTPDWTEV